MKKDISNGVLYSMKTKIAIKSIFGQILFEYKGKNNTIKETLQKAVSQGINLSYADLHNINLRGTNLCGINLRNADLRGANLRGADLHCADLCCSNLHGAYLDGAYLHCTNLRGVNLRGAYLRGSDLRYAYLENAHLGSWGKLKDSSDILTIGIIGSRDDYTTIYHTDKGIFVQCGCFSGTLDDFVIKVKETHKGNKHERDYLALVEFAKIKFENSLQ